MHTSRKGIGSGTKTGVVVALIFIVLAGVYFAPSLSTGGTLQSTSLQGGGASSSSVTYSQTHGLLPLFQSFSQMDLQVAILNTNEANPIDQQQSVSYLVLGKASINSTQYTKVEFSTAGVGHNVIAWFDSQGRINRVDVLGQGNYTGSGAVFFASNYVSTFTLIPNITNNATLLSMLSKTAENSTKIGPTLVDLTTYSLAVPTSPYKSITLRFATIPGTSDRFAVYLHERITGGMETTIQVTSLTKSH